MKKSNNTPIPNLTIHKETMYQYLNDYNNIICKIVSLPILIRLNELSINKAILIKLLSQQGFKYSYSGLTAALSGHNFRAVNMDYFSKIYFVLGLPLPSPESLLNTYVSSNGKVNIKSRKQAAKYIIS
jgi:hypothetical protein